MRFRLLTLAASALILSGGVAVAQQTTPQTTPQQQGQGMGQMGQGMGQGMMGRGMGRGMMGRGKGHGMHRGAHMRIMFALLDADGDGGLSLEEVQTAHARIFKAVDTDSDGKVTYEEMVAFFRGGPMGMGAPDDDDNDDADE
jgi:hypothetical protein